MNSVIFIKDGAKRHLNFRHFEFQFTLGTCLQLFHRFAIQLSFPSRFRQVFFAISLILSFLVLLQFSWRRGSKDSRVQGFKCLFAKDFINAFTILSIYMMSFFFAVPNPPFQRKDTAGPLICEVRPYLDSFGNFDSFLYIFKQSSYDFCQAFSSL